MSCRNNKASMMIMGTMQNNGRETPKDKIIIRLKAENAELKKRLFNARQRIMELEQELHDWIDKASN